jgi:hypothetical protein
MAETRNYNYGGVTPSWTLITSQTFSSLAADQSYTQDFAFSSFGLNGSTFQASVYMSNYHPASGYRGNYIFTLIDSISGFTQYYFQRVHSDVVTASYNSQVVHRVIYNGDTVFQRQINFGKAVDNVTQVTRTISSLTFRFTNTDASGIPVNILALLNQSTTETAAPSVIRTDLSAGSTHDQTYSGLSQDTEYYIHNRLQPTAANPSILTSERWFESWRTLVNPTTTPSIVTLTRSQTGSPSGGNIPYVVNYTIQNNDSNTVDVYFDSSINPPSTLRGTASGSGGFFSGSINYFLPAGTTLTFYLRTKASTKAFSSTVSQSLTF